AGGDGAMMATYRAPAEAGVSFGRAPSRLRPPPAAGRQFILSDAAGGVEGRGIRIAGYAALFGVRDAGRDVILPGAFAATLAGRNDPLPLYWQHRPSQRIGWIESAREDAKGLRVIARLDAGTRGAVLLGRSAVSGLSFGYRAREFRRTPEGRELRAVELFEVSLVTHPLQHGARVHWIESESQRKLGPLSG
ncbi:MAG TPA: HK97 family phage prohead protease, partial [Qipengyuania sp.]|nr:HK97 family phage prohead protease [Qipengyuania sp.]